MNEEMEMRDSVILKRARQADMRRNLRLGLTDLSQPKNEYMITVQPVPVDDEKPEEKMEDYMSDSIAQNEFDAVKKRMDDGTKKALRSEQKIKLLTNRYKMRAAKIWSQVEATFKHMETAEIEYKCLKALKRQEHLAASNRISNIREDVQKQKELEKTLQNRYGDLFVEQERIHSQTEK
ncbi:hypothetical protein Tco_0679731 [Tanacetum coccineum]|uniref:Uncharacterized protein n=1 Tax=Tanacetum coccineum TaxID=301880 RepID=A0ABQ4XJB6_9ASTR